MSYNVLAQGLSNLVWVPTMICFGKRWTVLASMVILLPCIAWAASAHSYNSLLAARILSGFASGTSESFAPVIIGDIWFEKDLTTALGFFAFSTLAGAGLGQMILGFVTEGAGWRWAYWVTFIACAVNLVTMIFWLPETTYQRGLVVGVTAGDVERKEMSHHGDKSVSPENTEPVPISSVLRPNLWFWKHPHVEYDRNWFLCFVYPLRLVVAVPVLWSSITYAVGAGSFTAIGICVPQLLGVPPYNFGSAAQGLFGLSALVGISIGATIGTKAVDLFNARIEARRLRQGKDHKPEERLLMLIIPFFTATTGLVMYGVTVQKLLPWIVPAVAYALHCFGFVILAGITFSYAIDSYLVRSGEVMVFNNTVRALISFIITHFTPNFIITVGPTEAYSVLAAVIWGLLLFTIPMFIFGPYLRDLTHRLL